MGAGYNDAAWTGTIFQIRLRRFISLSAVAERYDAVAR
jgi:hypothetical protein